jgi:hypothetical protein
MALFINLYLIFVIEVAASQNILISWGLLRSY